MTTLQLERLSTLNCNRAGLDAADVWIGSGARIFALLVSAFPAQAETKRPSRS